MSPTQMCSQSHVYDKQQSDATMKTLDNIIEELNPKSIFEVQITRFCCILLGQIKEMNGAAFSCNEFGEKFCEAEVKTEPLVYEAKHPVVERDANIPTVVEVKLPDQFVDWNAPSVDEVNPSYFVKSDHDDHTNLLTKVAIYRDGNKTEQEQCIVEGFNYDSCVDFSCNEFGENLSEADVKTEPLVYEAKHAVVECDGVPTVVECDGVPTVTVVKANISDAPGPSVVEADQSFNYTIVPQTPSCPKAGIDGDAENYKCTAYGNGFLTKFNLVNRMRTQTGELKRPHKCSVCGKGFTEKSHLTVHMRIHTGERPYKCTVCTCGKGFTQKTDLTRHMRIHTGEPPYKYKCTVCGKGFTKNGSLTSHMGIHTGERPHKCIVCGRGFTDNGSLTSHMGIHDIDTGERPYTCSVGGKGFTENGNLTSHMGIHTGERPYTCSVCGKGFVTVSDVAVHMMTHPGECH